MIVNTIKEQAIGILNRRFPNSTIESIDECANDWSRKQVTTIGLVNFYKAYYNSKYTNH